MFKSKYLNRYEKSNSEVMRRYSVYVSMCVDRIRLCQVYQEVEVE